MKEVPIKGRLKRERGTGIQSDRLKQSCHQNGQEKKGRKRERDERFVPRITFLIREP